MSSAQSTSLHPPCMEINDLQTLEDIRRSARKFLISVRTKLAERILPIHLDATYEHRIASLNVTVHRISPNAFGPRLRVGFAGEHVPVREVVNWDRRDIFVCRVIPSIVA
jgi:hypothetical protein